LREVFLLKDFYLKGFLGDEAKEFYITNSENHKTMFDFCEELNRYTIKISQKLNIHSRDARELIIGGLFVKILNSTQSAIILTKYGLDIEAQVLERTALEALFWLSAIVKRNKLHLKFIETHDAQRNELIKSIKKNPESFHPIIIEKSKECSTASESEIKTYPIETIASIAGLKVGYDNIYSMLCLCVHPDAQNLENKYFHIENEVVKSYKTLPSTENIEIIAFTYSYIILNMLGSLDKYFKLNIENELNDFKKKVDILFDNK
jgi:hypothetical protein